MVRNPVVAAAPWDGGAAVRKVIRRWGRRIGTHQEVPDWHRLAELMTRIATMPNELSRRDARAIWDAAVAAVRPDELVRRAVTTSDTALTKALATASRIIVVG